MIRVHIVGDARLSNQIGGRTGKPGRCENVERRLSYRLLTNLAICSVLLLVV